MTQGIALNPNAPGLTVAPSGERQRIGDAASVGDDDLRREVGRFVAGTFFSVMMRAMRKTVPEDGLMSGERGETIFREFFDRELGERFADGANFPQVEAAVRQLSGKAVYRQRMPLREGAPQLRGEATLETRPTTDGEAAAAANGGDA